MTTSLAPSLSPTRMDLRRRNARRSVVLLVLGAVAVVLAVTALCVGAAGVGPFDVVRSLVGHGTTLTDFVVLQLRLPRVAAAVVVGMCFGMSGAIFQSLLRNPLASPDILGVSASASAAGIVGIVSFGLSGPSLSTVTFAGSLVAALAIYALAWRGGVTGYRFILIGIGIQAMATSAVSYVLTRGDIKDVQQALVWLTGSLNSVTWTAVRTAVVAGGVLAAVALTQSRRLLTLSLDDDTATALGVRPERSRLALLVLAVGLAAVGVATAGPVAFVAFLAPPVARRLRGDGRPALLTSGLVGAVIVQASDLVAQHALPGTLLPAGVVTGLLGGPYLLWLLTRTNRVGRGG